MPLTLGYKTSHERSQPDKLLADAVLADKSGFETLWTSDHFHPWAHTGAAGGFAWVWVASAAERTRNMRIGTSVTAPILRYHPAVVAQAFATLAFMYPNRIMLGLGTGEAMNESPLGYKWPSPGQRVEMLEEAIIVIKKLWSEAFVSFDGKYYKLKKANLYTKPNTPVKMYVAAGGPRVAELAGRLADGIILGSDLEKVGNLLQAFENGARKSGRDPSSLERGVELIVSYDEDYERALKSCRFWAGATSPRFFRYDVSDPREIEAHGSLVPDETLAEKFIIATNADEHIGRIERYIKAGFNHLWFQSSSPDEPAFLSFYGKSVLPRLRR